MDSQISDAVRDPVKIFLKEPNKIRGGKFKHGKGRRGTNQKRLLPLPGHQDALAAASALNGDKMIVAAVFHNVQDIL